MKIVRRRRCTDSAAKKGTSIHWSFTKRMGLHFKMLSGVLICVQLKSVFFLFVSPFLFPFYLFHTLFSISPSGPHFLTQTQWMNWSLLLYARSAWKRTIWMNWYHPVNALAPCKSLTLQLGFPHLDLFSLFNSKYVHPNCMKSWRTSLLECGRERDVYKCTLCQHRLSIKQRNPLRPLLNYKGKVEDKAVWSYKRH